LIGGEPPDAEIPASHSVIAVALASPCEIAALALPFAPFLHHGTEQTNAHQSAARRIE
jgi:hypothetical protein